MSETQATQAKWRKLAEQCRDEARNTPQERQETSFSKKRTSLKPQPALKVGSTRPVCAHRKASVYDTYH